MYVSLETSSIFLPAPTQVCKALRKACQVETDPRAISAYLIFIGEHAYRDQDMNDLVLDLSQFLVERSTLVTHVLPSTTGSGSAKKRGGSGNEETSASRLSRHVLGHLLAIMVDYIRKVRRGQGEARDGNGGDNEYTNDQVRGTY